MEAEQLVHTEDPCDILAVDRSLDMCTTPGGTSPNTQMGQ